MRVLMPAITNGATHDPNASSCTAPATFGWRVEGASTPTHSEYGSASSARSDLSRPTSFRTLSRLATVPPEAPPRIALTRSRTRVSGAPKRRCASRCSTCTPRSEGMESKPQQWTMRAPLAFAAAS